MTLNMFEAAFERAVAQALRPAALMAQLVRKKIVEAYPGASPPSEELIAAAIQRKIDAKDASDSIELHADGIGVSGDAPKVRVSLTEQDLADFVTLIDTKLSEIVENVAPGVAVDILSDLKKDAKQRLGYLDADQEQFEARLRRRWRRPLHLLALLIAIAADLGDTANDWLRRRNKKRDKASIETITRLHARSCQISREILKLLQSGFADGAISRWRTLHEVAIVTLFIHQCGETTAHRYIDHLRIDSLKMARKYRAAAVELGLPQLSSREFDQLLRAEKRLVAKYGRSFRKDYGWAANALSVERPNFEQIEAAVDAERLRPYVKLASDNVHAGPKGAFFRLGTSLTEQPILLAGASNAGLEEAGLLTAMSLVDATLPLMTMCGTFDAMVWSHLLHDLSLEVQREFNAHARRLSKDDRDVQRQERRIARTGRSGIDRGHSMRARRRR